MLTKEILDQDYRRLTQHSHLASQMMGDKAHEFFLIWLKTQSWPFFEWASDEGGRIRSMKRGETLSKRDLGSIGGQIRRDQYTRLISRLFEELGCYDLSNRLYPTNKRVTRPLGETLSKTLPGSLPDGFVFTLEPDNVLIEGFAEYKIASSEHAESIRRQLIGVKSLHRLLYSQDEPGALIPGMIDTRDLPLSIASLDRFTYYYEFPEGGLRILSLFPEIKNTNLEANSVTMTVPEIKLGLNGILADIQHFRLSDKVE